MSPARWGRRTLSTTTASHRRHPDFSLLPRRRRSLRLEQWAHCLRAHSRGHQLKAVLTIIPEGLVPLSIRLRMVRMEVNVSASKTPRPMALSPLLV
jgi:hypothetical protein